MDVLHELARTVVRYFYDERCITFVEFLLHDRILSDEELADRMRMVLKDVNRTAAKLREDKLLKSEARQEIRASDGKQINKTYYYIDFKTFVDVVKYKMFLMRKSLEIQIENEMANKGYKCPKCGKGYAALELSSLLNPQSGLFECEICNAEIEEHAEDPAKIKATQLTLSQLMEQTEPLLRLLKKTDSITIPHFDPAEYLKRKQAFATLSAQGSAMDLDESTALAGSLTSPSMTSVNIQIQIEESDQPAQSHALPSWYTHSTVTGERIISTDQKKEVESSTTISSFTMDTTETEAMQQYYEGLQSSASLGKRLHEDLEETNEVEDVDVMVSVAGFMKRLQDVTDEDKSIMTPDEYVQYYEAYSNAQE